MYYNSYDLQTIMIGSISMGAFVFWLFNKFAERDSDVWDKSYESKRMRITRITLMCIWGLYVVIALGSLIFSWNSLPNNQIVSLVNAIIIGLSLFYYELTLRQSPRSVWVKVRKVIAYILICLLFGGVWPTTVAQFTTLQVPGVYGDALGLILGFNALIYGISILIIWLLLRHYKTDRLIPYEQQDAKEIPSDILDMHEEKESKKINEKPTFNGIPFPYNEKKTKTSETTEPKMDVKKDSFSTKKNIILKIKDVLNVSFLFFRRIWKWITGTIILVALIIGGVALYNYLHNEYLPKKKLDGAVDEIIQKFKTENTKVEYAYYILQKGYDWGFENVSYKYFNGNEYISSELSDYREDAFNVIENLAYQGDAQSQFNLGCMYYDGDKYTLFKGNSYVEVRGGIEYNIKRDEEKAAYWWLESAQNGYIGAFNSIGICYKEGIGVPKDMNKAIEWLRRGAETGEPWAQKNYGDLFLNGVKVYVGSHFERRPYYDHTGYDILWYEKVEVSDYKTLISVDIEQAKYWWKKSAAQGNEAAKERLQKIYE